MADKVMGLEAFNSVKHFHMAVRSSNCNIPRRRIEADFKAHLVEGLESVHGAGVNPHSSTGQNIKGGLVNVKHLCQPILMSSGNQSLVC